MDDRERKPDNRNNKKRNYQLYIILAIVAAVTVALITGLDSLVKKSTTKKVTYDEFVEAVEEGKVDSVKISSARVTFTLTDDLRMTYYTPYLPDSNLLPMLNEAGVEYTGTEDSSGSAILEFILVYILPFALIWILMGFFMRRIGGGSGGMMGIEKANTATNMSRATGVTFADALAGGGLRDLVGGCGGDVGLQEQERRFWQEPLQARLRFRSSHCLVLIL